MQTPRYRNWIQQSKLHFISEVNWLQSKHISTSAETKSLCIDRDLLHSIPVMITGNTALVLVVILLVIAPAAATIIYYGPNGNDFSYEEDYYRLLPHQSKAGDPARTDASFKFSWFSNFMTNGAYPTQIRTSKDKDEPVICGIEVEFSDGKVFRKGDMSNTSTACTLGNVFDFNNEGILHSMKNEGEDGKFCRMAISSAKDNVTHELGFGNEKCGSNSDDVTITGNDLGSGILAGFQGYASSNRIYYISFLTIDEIASTYSTTDSIDFNGNVPISDLAFAQTTESFATGPSYTGSTTKEYSYGYKYVYTSTTTQDTYYGVSATYSMSYGEAAVSQSFEGNVEYQYEVTTSQVEESEYTYSETTTYSLERECCPSNTSCYWNYFQGTGEIASADGATSVVNLQVKLVNGNSFTQQVTQTYSGSSSTKSLTLIATTTPVDADWSSCYGSGRRLHGRRQSPQKADFNFKAMFKTPRKMTKRRIINYLTSKTPATKRNILLRNPWLANKSDDDYVAKGTNINFTVKRTGWRFPDIYPDKN